MHSSRIITLRDFGSFFSNFFEPEFEFWWIIACKVGEKNEAPKNSKRPLLDSGKSSSKIDSQEPGRHGAQKLKIKRIYLWRIVSGIRVALYSLFPNSRTSVSLPRSKTMLTKRGNWRTILERIAGNFEAVSRSLYLKKLKSYPNWISTREVEKYLVAFWGIGKTQNQYYFRTWLEGVCFSDLKFIPWFERISRSFSRSSNLDTFKSSEFCIFGRLIWICSYKESYSILQYHIDFVSLRYRLPFFKA